MGVLTKALAPPTGELSGMTDVVFFAETIEFHDGDEKNHERLVFTDKYQVNGLKSRKHLHVNADPFRAVWPGGGSAATRGGAVSPLREEGSRRPPSKKNQSGGRGATAGGRGATAGGVVCTVEVGISYQLV